VFQPHLRACALTAALLQVPAPFHLSEGKGKDAIGRSAKQVLSALVCCMKVF
jgi:hypothetical protein